MHAHANYSDTVTVPNTPTRIQAAVLLPYWTITGFPCSANYSDTVTVPSTPTHTGMHTQTNSNRHGDCAKHTDTHRHAHAN